MTESNFTAPIDVKTLTAAAKTAAHTMATATTRQKNDAIRYFADLIKNQSQTIIDANQKDVAAADNLSSSLKERLLLDESRINGIIHAAHQVIELPDPIGEISQLLTRPSGIQIGKMRVPLGVILAIYESRPNVTADIGILAIKSGNVAILRGGSEARHSNIAIGRCLSEALIKAQLPAAAAQVVASTDRAIVEDLLTSDNIDLAIPRGGKSLIERVSACARMPTIKHLHGNCHVYVDNNADINMALAIIVNAKTRRYGVCNAAESLLIHAQVAAGILPPLTELFAPHDVEIRGCPQTQKILPQCARATEEDWHEEYLAPIISIKIVDDIDAAIAHINYFGSGHTDAIITHHIGNARRFLREVDSSSVILNASTAFADGGEYGLGAEVGISTDKFHARGPVGLTGLTCEKYIVIGDGNIRA